MTFKLRLKELGKNIPGGEKGWCEGIAESPEARGRGGKGGRRVPEDAGKVGRGGEATRACILRLGSPCSILSRAGTGFRSAPGEDRWGRIDLKGRGRGGEGAWEVVTQPRQGQVGAGAGWNGDRSATEELVGLVLAKSC